MRRMLDPKEADGSLPSTIEFDKDGNRKVGKNLGVNGKLTLKSLISSTNPDGDITKELGGGGGGVKLTQEKRVLSLTLNSGSYKVGDTSNTWTGRVEPNLVSIYVSISDIVFTIGTAVFIAIATLSKGTNEEYWNIKFVCIKEGTISVATSKDITITLTSIA